MYQLSGRSRIMLTDERVTVRREASDLGDNTIVVDGKRVKRGYEDFDVLCNVQPVSGNDLLQVPEGDRFDDNLWFWFADSEEPVSTNDFVCRRADNPDGDWYLLIQTEGWGSYTKALAQKVDTGPLQNLRDVTRAG